MPAQVSPVLMPRTCVKPLLLLQWTTCDINFLPSTRIFYLKTHKVIEVGARTLPRSSLLSPQPHSNT